MAVALSVHGSPDYNAWKRLLFEVVSFIELVLWEGQSCTFNEVFVNCYALEALNVFAALLTYIYHL